MECIPNSQAIGQLGVKMIKADATGNTFIMMSEDVPGDDRSSWVKEQSFKEDGVIWVEQTSKGFAMDYYNRDGSNAALCGNGTRSVIAYLFKQGLISLDQWVTLTTASGELMGKAVSPTEIMVSMPRPEGLATVQWRGQSGMAVRVGVPHLVFTVDSWKQCKEWDLEACFRTFSAHSALPDGANVNCYAIENHQVFNRTFERGVERETLSCGTGCVATAWAIRQCIQPKQPSIPVHTKGGLLTIEVKEKTYFLKGKVELYELV